MESCFVRIHFGPRVQQQHMFYFQFTGSSFYLPCLACNIEITNVARINRTGDKISKEQSHNLIDKLTLCEQIKRKAFGPFSERIHQPTTHQQSLATLAPALAPTVTLSLRLTACQKSAIVHSSQCWGVPPPHTLTVGSTVGLTLTELPFPSLEPAPSRLLLWINISKAIPDRKRCERG